MSSGSVAPIGSRRLRTAIIVMTSVAAVSNSRLNQTTPREKPFMMPTPGRRHVRLGENVTGWECCHVFGGRSVYVGMDSSSRTVVIVGGGLSGLSAAVHLGRSGIPAVLFDEATELGGRVRRGTRTGTIATNVVIAAGTLYALLPLLWLLLAATKNAEALFSSNLLDFGHFDLAANIRALNDLKRSRRSRIFLLDTTAVGSGRSGYSTTTSPTEPTE